MFSEALEQPLYGESVAVMAHLGKGYSPSVINQLIVDIGY